MSIPKLPRVLIYKRTSSKNAVTPIGRTVTSFSDAIMQ